jgi:hypothetical protein
MNKVILLALFCTVFAWAGPKTSRSPASSVTTLDPVASVVHKANGYIAYKADLGGTVQQPCNEAVVGSETHVSCSGVYHIMGPGGGGDIAVKFSCGCNFTSSNGKYTCPEIACEDASN